MKKLENSKEVFENFERELPFKVPSGYFEDLPLRIQSICLSQEKERVHIPLLQLVKSQLALAMGFVILAALAFAGYYYIKPPSQNGVLTNDDYIEIVEKHISDFDEGHLLNAVKDTKEPHSPSNDLADEMIRYLLKENVDYVTLMEQY
jgi:hypothetical protein